MNRRTERGVVVYQKKKTVTEGVDDEPTAQQTGSSLFSDRQLEFMSKAEIVEAYEAQLAERQQQIRALQEQVKKLRKQRGGVASITSADTPYGDTEGREELWQANLAKDNPQSTIQSLLSFMQSQPQLKMIPPIKQTMNVGMSKGSDQKTMDAREGRGDAGRLNHDDNGSVTYMKKQFLRTQAQPVHESRSLSAIGFQSLGGSDGQEDLSPEEDVYEEDILEQWPRVTQHTNKNVGGLRGQRKQTGKAEVLYSSIRSGGAAQPFVKHGVQAVDSQASPLREPNGDNSPQPIENLGMLSDGFSDQHHENIVNTPSANAADTHGSAADEEKLRDTSRRKFNVKLPNKGRANFIQQSHRNQSQHAGHTQATLGRFVKQTHAKAKFAAPAISKGVRQGQQPNVIRQLSSLEHLQQFEETTNRVRRLNSQFDVIAMQSSSKRHVQEADALDKVKGQQAQVPRQSQTKGERLQRRLATKLVRSKDRSEIDSDEDVQQTKKIKPSVDKSRGKANFASMERASEMSDFERDHLKATQGLNSEQNFNQAVNHMMQYNSNSRIKRPEVEPYGHKRMAGMNGAAVKREGGVRRFLGQNGLTSKRPERSPDDLIQQEESRSPERELEQQPDERSLRRRAAFHAAKASKQPKSKDATNSLPRTIKAQNFEELDQSDEEISEKVGKKQLKRRAGTKQGIDSINSTQSKKLMARNGYNVASSNRKGEERRGPPTGYVDLRSEQLEVQASTPPTLLAMRAQRSAESKQETTIVEHPIRDNFSPDFDGNDISERPETQRNNNLPMSRGRKNEIVQFSMSKVRSAEPQSTYGGDNARSIYGLTQQSQGFGPSGLDSSLQTPIKKADGDTFGATITRDNFDGPDTQRSHRNTMMSSSTNNDFLRVSTAANLGIDNHSGRNQHKNERIELLRKSIGRGKRGSRGRPTPQERSNLATPSTREAKEQRLRANTFHEVTEVARHFQKAPRLLEDFFVIGVSQEDIQALRESMPQQRQLPQDLYHPARLLYSYSDNTTCQRRQVVKDFCFPSAAQQQVHLSQLRGLQDVHQILYGQMDQMRRNIFIFNMQADDIGDAQFQQENVYHCVCLIRYEVVKVERPGRSERETEVMVGLNAKQPTGPIYYKCPKAYVIMSRHPFFEFFVHVLCQIMGIFKLEMIERSREAIQGGDGDMSVISNLMDISFTQQVQSDVKAALSIPVMVSTVKTFLDILFEINLAKTSSDQSDMLNASAVTKSSQTSVDHATFGVDFNGCRLNERMPLSLQELQRKALTWYTPLLLSLLDVEDPTSQLLHILANVVLEKSMIVVGCSSDEERMTSTKLLQAGPDQGPATDNSSITLISSLTNCFARLIWPLSWAQTLIPILPCELIDVLDAPMPYLVGIRARELIAQVGSQNESDFMMYIDGLDCLEQKCVVQITGTPHLNVMNFEDATGTMPDPKKDSKYLLLGKGPNEDQLRLAQMPSPRQQLAKLLHQFHGTLKRKKDRSLSSQPPRQCRIFEPCFQATEQQQKICAEVIDFLHEQIFGPMLEPIDELAKIGDRFQSSEFAALQDTDEKPLARSKSQVHGSKKPALYTIDEIKEFVVCQLAQRWTQSNPPHTDHKGQFVMSQSDEFKRAKKFYEAVLGTQNMMSLVDSRIGVKW